jgi:hypothetical protein
MFVQSEKFVESHGGRIGDIAIYGQESNYTTWRLAKMNLAVRGIDADIRWNNEGSFHKDELKDLRFDFVLANPPFNISDWGGERLREDARWTYGAPPVGNANYAWLQHILWHLAPSGTAGVVLAKADRQCFHLQKAIGNEIAGEREKYPHSYPTKQSVVRRINIVLDENQSRNRHFGVAGTRSIFTARPSRTSSTAPGPVPKARCASVAAMLSRR